MKIYVNELPKSCAECEHCTKAHEGKFGIHFCNVARMPIYNGQDIKGRGHHIGSLSDFDCPLKTTQSVQNQKAIEVLKKLKELFNDEEYMVFRRPDMVVDNLIKELSG